MNRQWAEAEGVEREKRQRDSITVFAEGQRVTQRIKQVRVKKIQRVGKGLMIIPPQDPGDEIRIARVGHRITQVQNVRPRQDRGEPAKREQDQRLADDAIALQSR